MQISPVCANSPPITTIDGLSTLTSVAQDGADQASGAGEKIGRERVAGTRRRSDVRDRHDTGLSQRFGQRAASTFGRGAQPFPRDGLASGHGLQAAGIAAAADGRVCVPDIDVPNAAGDALRPAVQPTLRKEAGADLRAEIDEQQVPVLLGRQRADFPHCRDLDGTSCPDRSREAVSQPFKQVGVMQIRHGTDVGQFDAIFAV